MADVFERINEGALIGGTIGGAIGALQVAASGTATVASGGTATPIMLISATAGVGEMVVGSAIGTLAGAGVGLLCGLAEEITGKKFFSVLDFF